MAIEVLNFVMGLVYMTHDLQLLQSLGFMVCKVHCYLDKVKTENRQQAQFVCLQDFNSGLGTYLYLWMWFQAHLSKTVRVGTNHDSECRSCMKRMLL